MRSTSCILCLFLVLPLVRAGEVEVRVKDRQAEFRLKGELVTVYRFEPEASKPYLWPLLAPGQMRVTRGYPIETDLPHETRDHVHHRSGWFCHGDVLAEGLNFAPSSDRHVKGVDFWSESKGHGKIVVTSAQVHEGTHLVTTNEWRDAAGVKVLDETRTLSLHEAAGGRLIVVDIRLEATVAPLKFGDTKEGSFAVRVHDDLALNRKKPQSRLVNSSGGSGEGEVWGRFADWCDYSGVVEGQHVGIALFDAPTNAHRAAWHARGYGLMAANPFGRKASGFPARRGETQLVEIRRGELLRLRYGIFLHAGDEKKGRVTEAFEYFQRVPAVTLNPTPREGLNRREK
jgi:hypothetical protein